MQETNPLLRLLTVDFKRSHLANMSHICFQWKSSLVWIRREECTDQGSSENQSKTAILMAPIYRRSMVNKWCTAKFLQICSEDETNSSTFLMAWGWFKCYIFIAKFHSWVNCYSFKHNMLAFVCPKCKFNYISYFFACFAYCLHASCLIFHLKHVLH